MEKNLTDGEYGIVLVTASSQKEAETIASSLIESQLAACVNLLPIHSVYTWQGKIHSDSEWQLIIKTDLALFSQLEKKIQELHSYEVPEIIAIPILTGSQPYLQWISHNVKAS